MHYTQGLYAGNNVNLSFSDMQSKLIRAKAFWLSHPNEPHNYQLVVTIFISTFCYVDLICFDRNRLVTSAIFINDSLSVWLQVIFEPTLSQQITPNGLLSSI